MPSNEESRHSYLDPNTFKKEKLNGNTSSIFKGLLLAILSGILYSSAAVIVKKMKNLYPGQLSMYGFMAILVFSLPESIKCGQNFLGPKDLRFLIIMRGICGGANVFLNFLAFRYLPLGEAAIIIISVPVFVTIAARICLKEPCGGIFQSVMVVLTVVGIIFTAKIPSKLFAKTVPYTIENIYGLLAAIGSLVFGTFRIIILRKVKCVHHAVVSVHLGWVGVLLTASLTFLIGEFHWHYCRLQGMYIILLGLLNFFGQCFLIKALQCELAGPVSTMRAAAEIVVAFLWQTFLFREISDIFSIIGACLVGSSVFLLGFRKWIASLPNDSQRRKQFKWMII